MSDNFWRFLETLGTNATIVTGLVWLARKIFEQYFSKDLEKFKSDLEKESLKFRIRYERLHTERADVIKELYRKLSAAYGNLRDLTCPMQFAGEPPVEEKAKSTAESANDLIRYYEENKIFLEESLASEIDNFITLWKDSWTNFLISQDMKKTGRAGGSKEWHEAWEQISKEGSKVKELIEDKFRDILGIEEN